MPCPNPRIQFQFVKQIERATEAASYVGMEDHRPGALSTPQMAFAFCYVVSHLALDLIPLVSALPDRERRMFLRNIYW